MTDQTKFHERHLSPAQERVIEHRLGVIERAVEREHLAQSAQHGPSLFQESVQPLVPKADASQVAGRVIGMDAYREQRALTEQEIQTASALRAVEEAHNELAT